MDVVRLLGLALLVLLPLVEALGQGHAAAPGQQPPEGGALVDGFASGVELQMVG